MRVNSCINMMTESIFAVASIMLIGTVVVFALPTLILAAKIQWCSTQNLLDECFSGKGQCEKWRDENPGAMNFFKRTLG